MRPRNMLGLFLIKNHQTYRFFRQFGMPFFHGACFLENGLFPKHLASVFQCVLPDKNRWRGLQMRPSNMAFQRGSYPRFRHAILCFGRPANWDEATQKRLLAPYGSIPSGVFGGPDLPKRGFGPDSDPHGSKSGSEGIPWQLFSSRISWQSPNLSIMAKMGRNIAVSYTHLRAHETDS